MLKKPQNILVVTYWDVESALIQTYTLPYLRIMQKLLPKESKLFLFTLGNSDARGTIEKLEKENIHVLQKKYHRFGWMAAVQMGFLATIYLPFFCMIKKIDRLHAWCTPGGAIAYLVSRLTGKPFGLDSFEPHAIPMVESHTWKRSDFAFRLLFSLEKKQYKKAKYVITAAQGMDRYAEEVYGIHRNDCLVKPACVNLIDFSPAKRKDGELLKKLNLKDKIVCVYAGKFGGLYLEKETFDFFKAAANYFGDNFRVLLLTNHSDQEISDYCRAAGLNESLIVKQFVPHAQIARYIGLGDFGICPMKPLPSRRYGAPIKNGEYWAMGLPVVITKGISNDSELIARNNAGYVLQELSENEYRLAAEKIAELLTEKDLHRRIRYIAEEQRNFLIAEKVYSAVIS